MTDSDMRILDRTFASFLRMFAEENEDAVVSLMEEMADQFPADAFGLKEKEARAMIDSLLRNPQSRTVKALTGFLTYALNVAAMVGDVREDIDRDF